MDIEKTNNLQMPLLIPNQSGKEVTHNEALIIIDNLLKNVVVDKDLTEPPANVNDNDLYIVGANASGDWINMDKYLAFYDNGWRFIEPRENFIFYVLDENKFYKYSNNDWIELNINIGDLHLSKLGINTSCSSTNRLNVSSDGVLFNYENNDIKVNINKNTSSDVASCRFQCGGGDIAEIGLISNNNFTLKVSGDGENWNNSFVVDASTGNIDFKGVITNNGLAVTGVDNVVTKVQTINLSSTESVIFTDLEEGYNYKIQFTNVKNSVQHWELFGVLSSDNGLNYVTNTVYKNNNVTFGSTSDHNVTDLDHFLFAHVLNGVSFGGGSDTLFINGCLTLFHINTSNNAGKIVEGEFSYTSSGNLNVMRLLISSYITTVGAYNAIKLYPSSGYFTSGIVTLYKQKL